MLKHNTSKDQENACGEPLNEPENAGNKVKEDNSDESESLSKNTEFSVEIKENPPKIVTPNNPSNLSFNPVAQDLDAENKEIYQINNFLR